ncbi:MATE family efflux transporter [Pseudofulvibacter geojedonensis]|uniref:Polysaccharide biosynthesis C-terminal domain-containing protein n=1 Tax=Pseudofulvibacter geojedonensis TaxID=1123758 RepID=A0ABW3I3N5_9FLAO
MSVLKRFFKDTFIYGLAIVLPRLINFLLTRLYTGVFKNEQFSENTVFYVYAAFFNVLFTYGMETAFFRFFSQHKDQEKVLATSFITLTISTLVFGILLFSFATSLANLMDINLLSYYILVSIILLETLVVLPFAYMRVTGRPIRFAIIKLLNVFIIVGLNILFLAKGFQSETLRSIFNFSNEVQYIFTANLIASTIIFICMLPYYMKVKWQLDKTILKSLLSYGWPIMIAGIAFVINENLDKLFLDKLDPHINGAYSACYKIAVFMTLFITAFKMGAEPFFFNQAKAVNAKENYARILKYFTIVGAIGLLGIVAYIDLIKDIIIKNESYLFALKIVPVIIIANLFLGIYNNLSIWYKLTDKTRYGMYLSILGAIITIILNFAFVPVYGFMVCAYATLIAYGSMMILSYYLGKKHYPVPYDTKRISIYLIGSIVLSALSFYQFDSNLYIGTLFLCLFLGLVFFLERNELKQILKKK